MFPLGSVLFPAMPLPLRVFEPRYLRMLQDIFEAEPAEFGVVLIERGQEVGGGEHRFAVGTVARVVQLGPGDGFVTVVAEGGDRFEVVEWLDDDPYPRALVQSTPEIEWHAQLEPRRAQVEAQVRRTLAGASEFEDQRWTADVALSDDPVAALWQLAAIAPIGAFDQLGLLRAPTAGELIESIAAATREAHDLRFEGL
ncbi:MAG: peptidase [Aeromicrobium sp.]|nr:peptidase [Aeromicrobium sp.]